MESNSISIQASPLKSEPESFDVYFIAFSERITSKKNDQAMVVSEILT